MAVLVTAFAILPAVAQTSFSWTNGAGFWATNGNWTNFPPAGSSAPLAGGSNDYVLTFFRPGAYATTNNLASPSFALNQLIFSNAAVTIAGSNLQFVAAGTGGALPQVLQNSATAVVINAGVTLGTNLTFGGVGGGLMTVGGAIGGAGAITKTSPNTLIFNGANSFVGNLLVAGGTLQVNADAALGSSANAITVSNATLRGTTAFTLGASRTITIMAGTTGTLNNLVLDQPTQLAGGGRLQVSGNGVVLALMTNQVNYTGDTIQIVGSSGTAYLRSPLAVVSNYHLIITAGVYEGVGPTLFAWTNAPGGGPGTFESMASGVAGWSAYNGRMVVNLGGATGQAYLTTGPGLNVGNNSGMILGGPNANDVTEFANPLSIGSSRALTVYDNVATNTDIGIISGVLSGGGTITKDQSGTLWLTATSAHTGGLVLKLGAVRANEGVGLYTNELMTMNGGVLEGDGAASFTRSLGTNASMLDFRGSGGFSAYGGKMTVNLAGGAALIWSNASSYTSGFLTNGASLILGAVTADSEVEFKNSLDLGGGARTISVTDNIFTNSDYATLPGAIVNGTLIKAGGGLLVLKGANTYAGGTTNIAGMLAMGADNALGGGTLVFAGGGLQSSDDSARTLTNALAIAGNVILGSTGTGDLLLNYASAVDLGTSTRTFAVSNSLTIISAPLTNTAGFTKAGPGTLVLASNNAWRGATTVSGGTLVLNGDNSQVTNVFAVSSGSVTNLGNLTLSGGSFGMQVGNTAGATGIFTEAGGLFQAGSVRIGSALGAAGIWNLIGGTTMVTSLSVNYGGAGTLLVSGPNTVLMVTNGAGSLSLGDVATNSATAQMTVSDGYVRANTWKIGARASAQGNLTIYGGTVEGAGGGQDFAIASSLGSTGTVTLAGAGALLMDTSLYNNAALSLAGGDLSFASLNVLAGNVLMRTIQLGSGSNSLGRITIGEGTVNILPTYYSSWGAASNGVGEVWLVDPNALLLTTNNSNQQTFVGSFGTGRVTISNGTWLANEVMLARYAGSQGSISLLGGRMVVNSNLTIGNGGYGTVLVTNGALLEIGTGFSVAAGTPSNSLLNAGGILQFAANSPTVTPNGMGSISVANGTVSFRGVTNAAVLGQITNIFYSGANTLRLDAATNSATSWVVSNGMNFSTLELVNNGSMWQGPSLLVGAGGLLRASNAVATLAAVLTNAGTVSVINGQLTYLSNAVLSGGVFLTQEGTNVFTRGLSLAAGSVFSVTNGASQVSGVITNTGRITVDNASVVFGGDVVNLGVYASDPSTNTFNGNFIVGPTAVVTAASGDIFALGSNFVMQSSNRNFNMSSAVAYFGDAGYGITTGTTNHVFDVSGSGALDLGHFTNFATVSSNFSIGTLSIAATNRLTVTGTKADGSPTNALYVGWLDIQGLSLGSTDTLDHVTNTLVAALNLPDINLYYDVFDQRNDWLTKFLPPTAGAGYDLWGGGLLLPIPEPSPLLALGAGLMLLGLLRRRGVLAR